MAVKVTVVGDKDSENGDDEKKQNFSGKVLKGDFV